MDKSNFLLQINNVLLIAILKLIDYIYYIKYNRVLFLLFIVKSNVYISNNVMYYSQYIFCGCKILTFIFC